MTSSIIIITFNGSKYLPECLGSAIREIGVDDEIIVVDNASTDGSADLVEQRWPQVRLVRNATNLGFAAACNQAAQMARGDTLVFLNQDTCVQASWLEGLLEPLEQDPTIGLVTSKVLLMSQPGLVHMCGQEVHFTGFAFGRGFLSASEGYMKGERVGAVSGASFAIRRRLWNELGGFDPLLFMYYEETDLCWRARLAGYASQFSPDSVVLHNAASANSPLVQIYSERNRMLLLLKNWKCTTLILLLPSLVLAEMIDWGYMLMSGWKGLRAKVKALGWLGMNFSKVLQARRRVQSARSEPDWVVLGVCTATVNPIQITGGRVGKLAIAVANVFFALHYRLVLSIAQRLDL